MKFVVLVVWCILGNAACFEDKTITQYLRDNGYSTLVSALSAQGLDTALSGTGPFTIFAPTDAAFAKLGQATVNSLTSAQLTSVLKYHVVNEFVLIPMVTSSTVKTTLEGNDLTLEPSQGTLLINNASRVSNTNNDVIVNNGVVQPIDTVLLPPVLANETITQILLKDDARFKDLFLALLLAGLTGALETGDYTLFAPTDSAFAAYKDNLLNPTNPNANTIYQEVLKYHVVPGGRRASQLSDGQSLFTLHGTSVNMTVSARGVLVNNANVIDTDIMATNGVIHAIDAILIPGDLGSTG